MDGGGLDTIEISKEQVKFQLAEAVQARLRYLLDREDTRCELMSAEWGEVDGLVELAEFLSRLELRAGRRQFRS